MKKRSLFIVLCVVLAALLLVACEDKHTEHVYGEWSVETEPTHTAKGSEKRVCKICGAKETRETAALGHSFGEEVLYETADGKVFSYTLCGCGEKNRSEVPNSYVVTPENAQDCLDKASAGAFLYFGEGRYGKLDLRQSKYESKVKKNAESSEYLDISGLTNTGVYHYYRTISNVTLYGGEGAVFTDLLTFFGSHQYGVAGTPAYDPVRDIQCPDTSTSFYSHLNIENLKLSNMKFEGRNAGVYGAMQMADTALKGFTAENCSFKGTDAENNRSAAINLITDLGGNYKDITVKNCDIDGRFQGVHVQNAVNVAFVGNTVKNTVHNAFGVQSSRVTFGGKILISGNKCVNIGDRAIRFNEGKDAEIKVLNNSFENVSEPDNQLLKSGTLTNCSYEFKGNTYGGAAMADVSGNSTPWIVTFA